MAIQGVETKCYILALFVRDDDERFLLGSGHYEFKDSQKQFSANTIQNDVVEVQGNDGFLLAGQVRRPGTQSFDGYIGDGTTEKTEVEEYRRQFFGFFRKNHFYRVIYVFPDGSAIQRKRGFLVDDATVQELYQQYPEYHVALNFEDVNYYTYSENEQGEEIYAEEAQIDLSSMVATGGLVWDEYGAVNQGYAWGGETTVSGTEFTVQNDLSLPAPITEARLNGDTYQQTYSGKNLVNIHGTLSERNVTTTISGEDITVVASNSADTAGVEVPVSYVANQQVTISFDATCNVYQPSTPNLAIVYMRVGNTSTTRINLPTSSGVTTHYEVTFTPTVDGMSLWLYVKSSPVSGITSYRFRNIQIEAGSTATDFEPYVGGVPAPNPDYPQEIQTVTGEQTVTVVSKNLFTFGIGTGTFQGITWTRSGNIATGQGTATSSYTDTAGRVLLPQPLKAGETYTFSLKEPIEHAMTLYLFDKNQSVITPSVNIPRGSTSTTFSKRADAYYARISIGGLTVGQTVNLSLQAQIEAGSTATDYQLNQSQSYPISLGSTELCKLGAYQDYIYKGTDGWYVHKATGKALLGSLTWRASQTNVSGLYRMVTAGLAGAFVPPATINIPVDGVSSHFLAVPASSLGTYGAHVGISAPATGQDVYIYSEAYNTSASAADFKTWLTDNNVVFYYALATPTDTKITDATLVSQLDALGSAKLMVGENNVLVSSTGTNLPAELQIKYYSTVSFDGAGFVWDEGGSGGPTTVQIDSITNVYPIWTVKGPAVNPELSVITTNTTLKYEGSVGANQTLVIDMMNKTAKLNGTSVIGNVTGDWVNFRPGINRVVYITDNADTPPSLIEWQEVVG